MLVGVDLDNTIVCYDLVFHTLAMRKGLIPPNVPRSKTAVRDYLRQSGQERAWTELQGMGYGAAMRDAVPFAGVQQVMARCRSRRIEFRIVSHRTRGPVEGPCYDLHRSAQDWLAANGFFEPSSVGLRPEHVFLEATRAEKLGRIESLGCSYFVDDLPNFLEDPDFPAAIVRILFDPSGNRSIVPGVARAASWLQVEKILRCGEDVERENARLD